MTDPDRPEDEAAGGARSFKVVDRRRFADEAEPEAGGGEAAEPAAEPPPAPEPGPEAPTSEAPDEPILGQPQGDPYDSEAASSSMEATFSTLVLSLSTQALVCLGEIPPGEGMAPQTELPAAKHLIDMLAVLQDKTRGNLDEQESGLLERILYDLRMRFVEVSRR